MSADRSLLLVEDEAAVGDACAQALQDAGYAVTWAKTGRAATEAITARSFPLAVLDLVLPDVEGLAVLDAVRARDPEAIAIMVTGFASIDTAVEAVHRGAYDYLQKPFRTEQLLHSLARGWERRQLSLQTQDLIAALEAANQELEQRRRELEHRVRVQADTIMALIRLGQQLSVPQGSPELLQAVLEAAATVLGADGGAILSVGLGEPHAVGEVCRGLPAADIVGQKVPVGDGVIGRVAATGVPIVENDLLGSPEAADSLLGTLGVRRVLAVPARSAERTEGVLALFGPADGQFVPAHLELAEVLANHAGAVLRRQREQRARTGQAAAGSFRPLGDLLPSPPSPPRPHA